MLKDIINFLSEIIYYAIHFAQTLSFWGKIEYLITRFTSLYFSSSIVLYVLMNWFSVQSIKLLQEEISSFTQSNLCCSKEHLLHQDTQNDRRLTLNLEKWKLWYSKLVNLEDVINLHFGFIALLAVSFTFLNTIIYMFYLIDYKNQTPFLMLLLLMSLIKYLAYLLSMTYLPQRLKKEVSYSV